MQKYWLLGLLAVAMAAGAAAYRQAAMPTGPSPVQINTDALRLPEDVPVTVVAEGLDIPWEIAVLPDGDLLVTERPGRLVRIGADKQIISVQGVMHTGEGGLQGLALHPGFQQNHLIYLYLTTAAGTGLTNRVEQYRLTEHSLQERRVIIDDIPGAAYHDGGRLAFGPDGFLYVATGDASRGNLAQDINSLAGKILRIESDGSIPPDNPFGNAVYSYGHRNPQGLAWDSRGHLWATEHGRSGAQSGLDEINLIEAGKNYGWPLLEGDQTATDRQPPQLHSGAAETWAPAGAAVLGDTLYFAGLRGEALYEVPLMGPEAWQIRKHWGGQYGRLRAVTAGRDGRIYVSTSNRDGRGKVQPGDDKILLFNPRQL